MHRPSSQRAGKAPIRAASATSQWQSDEAPIDGPRAQPPAPVGGDPGTREETPALTVARDAPKSVYGASEEPKGAAPPPARSPDAVSSSLRIEKSEDRGPLASPEAST